MNDILNAVKDYTARGWVCHPLSSPKDNGNSPGKKPLLPGWQNLQKTPDDIERFITQGCNIGLVCGAVSGITALDMDSMFFADDLFNGFDTEVKTLRSSRTKGRGHIYFKYNPNLPSQKHHDLGIEILNDGNNIVLPPSTHLSGDTYRWIDQTVPLIEMPKALEERIINLFKTETELRHILSKCRHCFRALIKRRHEIDWHGGEGRQYMLAVCTDLVAKGATENHIKMFAKLVYGTGYDESATLEEYRNIDKNKTWTCDKLKENLPTYIDLTQCEKCNERREAFKEKDKEKVKEREVEVPQHISQHIKDKADEVMTTGDPVRFILDTIQTMHTGDEGTAKALLVSVGCQSVGNSEGLQPKLSGDSGMGKSHVCKAMVHVTPKEYLLTGAVSDKALFYMKICPGTVYYCDDVTPSENLQSVIKQSTTHYRTGTKYHTVHDKKLVDMFIPPRLAWWITSVDDDVSMQVLNRQFNLEVDESTDQDLKVVQFHSDLAVKGEVEFPESDDVEVCREILRQVKQKLYSVKIPFANDIQWKDPSNRRNYSMFLDMIKSFAVLRFRQRQEVDGYLIATIDDYEDARELYCSRASNMRLKLNKMEMDVCRTIHELTQLQGWCDSKAIERHMNLSQQRVHQLIHGRKDRNESGLLSKVKGLHHELQNVKDGDRYTNKNTYTLDSFSLVGSYDSVVELSEKIKEQYRSSQYNHYNHTTTVNGCSVKPDTVDIKIYDNYITTTTTTNKSVHQTDSYIFVSKSEKSSLFASTPKIGCSGSSVATDSENVVVVRGSSGCNGSTDNEKRGSSVILSSKTDYTNIALHVNEWLSESYGVTYTGSNIKASIDWFIDNVTAKFDLPRESAAKIVKDAFRNRGWV
ncbi:Uncharacterised protein [uncultured archaeon]|nr:Uncharacterised protein [uncultured archaeon]